jgi:hypothetical protein
MLKVTYLPAPDPLGPVRKAALDRLRRAVARLHAALLEALNVPNTGTRVKGPGGRRRTVYPSPSKPGEPPRKRTGWLQRNVVYEIDGRKNTARIGVTAGAKYGAFLELGTRRMRARPWLLATLERVRPELAAILGGKA